MNINTNENKTRKITVRFTEREYNSIKKKIKKSDMKMSDYIRGKCLNEKDTTVDKINCSCIAAIAQELCNYTEEKYSGDKKIEGWCSKIWKHLL